jgi:hypothetical protein
MIPYLTVMKTTIRRVIAAAAAARPPQARDFFCDRAIPNVDANFAPPQAGVCFPGN